MEKRTSQVLISRSRKLEYLIPNPNVQPIKSEKTDYTSDGIRTCVNHKSTKWIRRKPKPSYMTSMKPKQIKRSKNISYLFLCLSSPPNQKLQTLYPNLGFPLSSWLSDPRNPTRRIRYDYPSYSIYVSYAPLPVIICLCLLFISSISVISRWNWPIRRLWFVVSVYHMKINRICYWIRKKTGCWFDLLIDAFFLFFTCFV